jgi:hypothetical protein
MNALPARVVRLLSRSWIDRLAPYRSHRGDEHREALVADAVRCAGLALENHLADSPYWSELPLIRRAAMLLVLVDRGAAVRVSRDGRYTFEAAPDAEARALAQPELVSHLVPVLELIAALRATHARRTPAEG